MSDLEIYSRPHLAIAHSVKNDLLILVRFYKEDLVFHINLSEIEQKIQQEMIHRKVYVPAYFNALSNSDKHKRKHPIIEALTEIDENEPIAISVLFYDIEQQQQKTLRHIEIIDVFHRAGASSEEDVYNLSKQWLKENKNIEIPDYDEKSNKKKVLYRQSRLKLSPIGQEELNRKVVDEVFACKDSGKGSLKEAYLDCANNSIELFGMELSAKSIEGRFLRNKKKFDK